MNPSTAYPNIEQYARFDFEEICSEADETWNFDPQLLDIDITETIVEEGVKSDFLITGKFLIEGLEFTLSYHCIDDINEDELIFDEITKYDLHDAYMHRYYMSMNQPYDAEEFSNRIESRGNVNIESSTAILAADEDPFADMGFDDSEDINEELSELSSDTPEEALDDITDTLDEINDSLEDFQEDNVDIELENNISNHYIAECDKCKGVFITAVELSDQSIEKISGVCPLCEEDCDQYLKWYITEV